MSTQTFKYAGLSTTAKGVVKMRFGNDMVSRIKKLKSNTGVSFIELPSPMTRVAAAEYFVEQGLASLPEEREAVARVAYRGVSSPRKIAKAAVVVSAPTVTEEVESSNV